MKNTWITLLLLLAWMPSWAQPCAGWGEGIDSIKSYRYYEEYRRLLDKGQQKEALFFWEVVYRKAGGATKNIYLDGVSIFESMYAATSDTAAQREYATRIAAIFEQRLACFPDDAVNIVSRKAATLWQLEREPLAALGLFEEVLEVGRLATPAFVISGAADAATEAYVHGLLSDGKRAQWLNRLLEIVAAHRDDATYQQAGRYAHQVMNRAVQQRRDVLAAEEAARRAPLSDCEQLVIALQERLEGVSLTDVAVDRAILQLQQETCYEAALYARNLKEAQQEAYQAQLDNSVLALRTTDWVSRANYALKAQNYEEAIALYRKAIQASSNAKAQQLYRLQIAKIQYSKLKAYEDAKANILAILEQDKRYAPAYLLLGDLYIAGSASCFADDPFTRKMVVYAAIDQWEKALALDDLTQRTQAQNRINQYQKYLPTKSELFLARSRFKGRYYYIGCWIDERVRPDE